MDCTNGVSGWVILQGFAISGFNCLGVFGVISLKTNVLNLLMFSLGKVDIYDSCCLLEELHPGGFVSFPVNG